MWLNTKRILSTSLLIGLIDLLALLVSLFVGRFGQNMDIIDKYDANMITIFTCILLFIWFPKMFKFFYYISKFQRGDDGY